MSPRKLIWLGIFIGSTVGGYVPTLWGAETLSFATLLGSFIGSFAGLWAGWKTSQKF